ncbi:prepilin peptidase [Lysobacter korlensis]|uniref:Prepilin peptidase n=1 Tax=Lysobacter korlensis TaxID=553636 RepID=A0ABV6RUR5_9GAMM
MTVAAGVFGALIGSFLNVVIARVPEGRSIVRPASACGACGHEIRWYDNVPVLSWLLLRARCRDCGAPISARYPLVEIGTALFFALVTFVFLEPVLDSRSSLEVVGAALALAAYLYLAAISVALAAIDLDVSRLPNKIVLPGYPVGAVLLGASALLTGEPIRLGTAAIGMAAMFGLYLILALSYPGGMGLGDVKLAGVLGLFTGWLGWAPLLVGFLLAFLLGGALSLALLATRRATGKTGIPFGPWMLAGAWGGILAGSAIASWYLGVFGLV